MALVMPSLYARDIILDVPYFVQGKGAPWAEEKLGNRSNLTIGEYGCALTCIAMVVSFFSEEEWDPSRMNRWLKNHDGFEGEWDQGRYWGQVMLNWPALGKMDGRFVYTRFNWSATPADTVLIRYYLDHGVPVIAEVTHRGAPHYVVLIGYEGEDFIMHDPEFPGETSFNGRYHISDEWGSGPGRNINGLRVIYRAGKF